jgi:hypothetical protein
MHAMGMLVMSCTVLADQEGSETRQRKPDVNQNPKVDVVRLSSASPSFHAVEKKRGSPQSGAWIRQTHSDEIWNTGCKANSKLSGKTPRHHEICTHPHALRGY